ncbi:MAG: T9SS type A sorting domain-containing protein, partial [Saprospiraceae bacterium]|nr:T9SS type A sorting domain-containing protein [Saprospiraceae bacterium]
GDGLVDLLMGERTGNINFFKNSGSPNAPVFPPTPTLQKIGQIDARVPPEVIGYSAPAIIQTEDGPVIVVGTQRGHLEAYYLQGATQDTFPPISLRWGNLDEGFRSHPALADIDNDGVLDMVVGNQRGGLSMYKTILKEINIPLGVDAPDVVPALKISPNPTRAWVRVEWPANAPTRWQVFNSLGQMAAEGTSENGSFTMDARTWASGIYVIKAESDGKFVTGRVVVAR